MRPFIHKRVLTISRDVKKGDYTVRKEVLETYNVQFMRIIERLDIDP